MHLKIKTFFTVVISTLFKKSTFLTCQFFSSKRTILLKYCKLIGRGQPGIKGNRTYNQRKSAKSGKTPSEQEFSDDSDGYEGMPLADNKQGEDGEIKALVDSGTDLIKIYK